jgi:hypothetical protein
MKTREPRIGLIDRITRIRSFFFLVHSRNLPDPAIRVPGFHMNGRPGIMPR